MYKQRLVLLILFFSLCILQNAEAQCTSDQIMEPGFSFLSSSRGCAPYSVQIETKYLSSTPGTVYFVNWGDNSPEDVYVQENNSGVLISHTYPDSPIECGYDITIDAENGCNPRGSVIPIETQVVVWTRDILSINPGVFRVCQGYAASMQFQDNSDWNCYPRTTRENRDPRWLQWIYGSGSATRISGVQINGVAPGSFPYNDPEPGMNPKYPVYAPNEQSLVIDVPATAPADIGKEFQVTMKNWNQCNPYDKDVNDGSAFNPVNGDMVNGDYAPQVQQAKIVIVDAPEPVYQTRLGNASGPLQTEFCVGDNIYFEDLTPEIDGAMFEYTWEFYDNETGEGAPLATSQKVNSTYAFSNGGRKMIRLLIHDANAAGNCVAIYESHVFISPTLIADIGVSDLSGNPIVPQFCQDPNQPQSFDLRFTDNSQGDPSGSTQWKWEFYDENNMLVRQEPADGTFSNTKLGPFSEVFEQVGVYQVKLMIRDNSTSCTSEDVVQVTVHENPVASFTADRVCEGADTEFTDGSSLNAINGEAIVLWEWDFNYDGTTFTKDVAYDNKTGFSRPMGAAGTYQVALRVTTDQNSCSDIIVKPVYVDPVPIAAITADEVSGCGELTVSFTNEGASTQADLVSEYIWELDKGAGFEVDSVQSPDDPDFSTIYSRRFENFTSSDIIYRMRLKSVTADGCESISSPVTISMSPGPTAGFMSLNYSPFDNNCSPLKVDFQVDNATQSLNPTAYEWTVADATNVIHQENTGTTPAFNYTFSNATQSVKDFYVTLKTTLESGCTGDSTRTIRINPVPDAQFSVDTLALDCDMFYVEFQSAQRGLANYFWEIRENGELTFASDKPGDRFDYKFYKNGAAKDVEVTLQTTNFANCKSEVAVQSFTVPKKENMNTSFTATPHDQTLPDATVFIDNTTNTGPWTYLWDFGDGSTSTDPNVSEHEYATYGTYTIKLSVSYKGCTETRAITVNIRPIPPIVDFAYDPASGCAPLTVEFTNLTKYAEANSYVWNFGDNQGSSKVVNPTFTYYEPGVYTVSLSATNAVGDTIREVKPLIIEVYSEPKAQFDVRPNVVHVPGDPLYTSNNSFGASFFHWDFGDGTTSLQEQPVHYYEEPGKYDITLVATSSYGCTDTTKMEGIVEAITGGNILVPNAFSPNLSGPIGGGSGGLIGNNDIFLPITKGVAEFEMLIYNRWGELLFQSTNKNSGWDGYYNGKLCTQDVYVYKLNLTYEDGRKATRMGDVNLIR